MDRLRIFLCGLNSVKATALLQICLRVMVVSWLILTIQGTARHGVVIPNYSSSWFMDMNRFLKISPWVFEVRALSRRNDRTG